MIYRAENFPVLFVAGHGRCGTTLVMTMLDAGGFPVTGPRPSYELPEIWRHGRPDRDWLRMQNGRAVKWIEPMLCPDMAEFVQSPVIILLERDARQQARSMMKMIGIGQERRSENRLRASIEKDRPRMRAHLGKLGAVYRWRFEDLLTSPSQYGKHLGNIVRGHFGRAFDDTMAGGMVMPRVPDCLPDLTVEHQFLPLISADLADRETEQ